VVEAAGDLEALLARCRGMVILATSRTALGLRAEREYPVPPLPLPADPASMPPEALMASPAVALFVDRARGVRHDFALTQANAAAVVERTLRATVAWSVGLLEQAERSLLETAAVFVDGWTVQAAAQVAGLDEDRALALSEALARHSLVYVDRTEFGPRSRMLETVREFAAERLAARADVAEVGRRHADHYRALAERADVGLRGVDQDQWAERLEAEAGNLAAAVRWYLAHDRAPLPHLFRVLWMFWGLRDHLGEAHVWVDQLLPTADSLDPQAQVELGWTAAVTALEVVGDDAAALAASQRLEPLLEQIDDPYLHAVSRLAMAGISAVVGDFDGALQGESVTLEELRGQDEPYWTAVAVLTAGLMETAMGRYDDALRHLNEARDLAERFDNAGLAAWSRVQLGTLAIVQGRLGTPGRCWTRGWS
jgi:tetratricopeptide (TPR) repeat protein